MYLTKPVRNSETQPDPVTPIGRSAGPGQPGPVRPVSRPAGPVSPVRSGRLADHGPGQPGPVRPVSRPAGPGQPGPVRPSWSAGPGQPIFFFIRIFTGPVNTVARSDIPVDRDPVNRDGQRRSAGHGQNLSATALLKD